MKKKLIITIASVALNLVLFAVLMRSAKLDNSFYPTPAAFFQIEHLPAGVTN